MKKSNQHLRYTVINSSQIQEIIGKPPATLTRWGSGVAFGVLLLLIGLCALIRYPDQVQAKVTITTIPAPVNLVARYSGPLILFKKDNEPIKKNEIIAMIRTTILKDDILTLENTLNQNEPIRHFKASGSLGELEVILGEVVKAEESLLYFQLNKSINKKIIQLEKQKSYTLKLHRSLVTQIKFAKEETHLAEDNFKVDSCLFETKVIALLEYKKSKSNWLKQKRSLIDMRSVIIQNEIRITELSAQIIEYQIKDKELSQQLIMDYQNTKNKLVASITKWKETYLFVSPIDGRVLYLGFYETNQFVEINAHCFSVIPATEELIAHGEITLRNSGKVKVGQSVNIRLENYPSEQFGALKGKVTSISLTPEGDKYRVEIVLQNGLVTEQNNKLKFQYRLAGNTEIITEDMSLLKRLIIGFRKSLIRE